MILDIIFRREEEGDLEWILSNFVFYFCLSIYNFDAKKKMTFFLLIICSRRSWHDSDVLVQDETLGYFLCIFINYISRRPLFLFFVPPFFGHCKYQEIVFFQLFQWYEYESSKNTDQLRRLPTLERGSGCQTLSLPSKINPEPKIIDNLILYTICLTGKKSSV